MNIRFSVQNLQKIISKPSKGILTVHVHPDADSVASNLVLADVLREYGHTVDVVTTEAIPSSMDFLEGVDKIRVLKNKQLDWKNYDHYWALDMSTGDRQGIATPILESLSTIVIDHHKSNKGWGSENIVDTMERYPSTCSLLYAIFKELGIAISQKRAHLLLTGIAGDTGFFIYGISPAVLRDAAELVETGADYEIIKKNLLSSVDISEFAFMSKAFARAKIYKNALFIDIPRDLWLTNGKAPDKNDLIVYYLSKIAETRLGVLLIEDAPFSIRVELRSRDIGFDVSALATALGGGGHKNAAGATLKNISLAEAVEKIKALL